MKSFKLLTAVTASVLFMCPHSQAEGTRVIASSPISRVKRSVANLPSKVQTQTTEREISDIKEQTGTGLGIFLGVGGGYFSVSSANPLSEPNKGGASVMGRGSLSFYNPQVTLDLGFGWVQSQIAGTSILNSGNTTTTLESSVFTRAGEVDFSPRFKFGSHFDIGPAAMVLLGTDSSFSDRVGGINTPVLLGAKTGFFLETQHILFRATAQAMTSVGLQDRKVLLASANLEVGIPLIGGRTLIREREIHTVQNNYERETVETETEKTFTRVEEKDVIREIVQFSFDDQIIHFEYDRANLTPDSREFVQKLGKYLSSKSDLWSATRVDGHTDSRGTDDYNQHLSEARAETIKKILIDSGVPSGKIGAKGYGKQRPIDDQNTDVARARNRRVELSFSDVRDARALRDEINRLKFATIRPTTCTGDHCR